MNTRQLGNSTLYTQPLVLGTNVFGWTIDETQSHQVLDAFTGAGFNMVDTADIYSRWKPGNHGGESEIIIGNWLRKRGNREKIIVATKVGGDMGQGGVDIRAAYIVQAAEASLKRLATDYIDLYQTHWDDPAVPVQEVLEAYARLIQAGKVRYIGASNITPGRLQEYLQAGSAVGLPAYISIQPEYNLYARQNFETSLLPVVLNNNIGVIPYFALAAGFLTGKYRSNDDLAKSARGGGMQKYMNERGFRILNALDEVAAAQQVTPAVIALAWLMQQPGITAPISSATSLSQLAELTSAANIVLHPEQVTALTQASEV